MLDRVRRINPEEMAYHSGACTSVWSCTQANPSGATGGEVEEEEEEECKEREEPEDEEKEVRP